VTGDETALQNVRRLDDGAFRDRPKDRVSSRVADPLGFAFENVMLMYQSDGWLEVLAPLIDPSDG
jgi:hypothetical protein